MTGHWRTPAGILLLTLIAGLGVLATRAVPSARAANEPDTDLWYLAKLDQQPVGSWRHREQRSDKGWEVTQILELRLRRYGAVVALKQEYANTETANGQVTGFTLKQEHNGKAFLHLEGHPKSDDATLFMIEDRLGRPDRQLPWSEQVVGLRAREKLVVGSTGPWRVLAHEPLVNQVVGMEGQTSDEVIEVSGAKVPCQKVTWQPKILQSGAPQLAPNRCWIDSQGRIVRRQLELDGLGLITLELSNQEAIREASKATPTRDLGDSSLISLDRPVPNARQARGVVYRLRWKEASGEQMELANDDHQQLRPTADGAVEILSRRGQKPKRVVGAPDAPRECLSTSRFIDTDHPRIREMAQRAGGFEDDCWTAALRLERYVFRSLKPDASVALIPASETVKNWRGDCRHAALVLAALCRASNLPSRTAVGLLYVEKGGKPFLGFHMWAEVFIDGQWIGLDGTLGQGGIGASHIKVSDSTWDKVESLAPLLPVQRLVGRLKGEVVKVDFGD